MPGMLGASRNAKMNFIARLVKTAAANTHQLGGQVLLMRINEKMKIWGTGATSWIAPDLERRDLISVIPEFLTCNCQSMETLLLLLNEAR